MPPAPEAAVLGPRSLQLELFINEETTKLVGTFVQEAQGGLTARREDLRDLGIDVGRGEPKEFLRLSDIPDLTYTYDEPRQRVDVTLPNERRMPHAVDARGQVDDVGPRATGYGAVLNYTLFAASMADFDKAAKAFRVDFTGASAGLEGRAFTPFGTLNQTAIVGSTTASASGGMRLDTTLTRTDPETAITYRAGDVISGGLSWTRPIRMGGLQVQRSFGLRPDLITAPLPSVSGSAAVPSTIDVLVDNVRTFSREVPAGPYSITNLPAFSSNGRARVVVRDASGRQVERSLPFFASASLLRAGIVDFSAQAGVPRLFYAVKSNAYTTSPVGVGTVRYGLTDNWTLEAHAEGGGGLLNGGAGLVTNAGGLGVVSIAGRTSRYGRALGYEGFASVETSIWGVSLGASAQRSFGRFDDLASVTHQFTPFDLDLGLFDGPRMRDPLDDALVTGSLGKAVRGPVSVNRLSVGVPFEAWGGSLGASLISVRNEDGGASRLVTASYSQGLWGTASLSLNAFVDLDRREQLGIGATFSMPLGEAAHASASVVSNGGEAYVAADASRSLGAEPGSYGYRARLTQGRESGVRSAAGAYRSRFGRVEASVDQTGLGARGSVDADGAVVITGDGIHFGNRIDDAFAVVDVGAPDVEVFSQNRSVGRTGSSGTILVPGLNANQKNAIRIDPTSLPVNANVNQTNVTVVPADRTGVRVDFGVRAGAQAAIVILHDAAGKPLRAGLRGRIEGRKETFLVGYDGRAYVNDLTDANRITVDLSPGECAAEFPFAPPTEDRQVLVGPIVCR